jgi:hypothetical protein
MIYYLQALINSRRGEITLWGAIGIVVLVLAYVTFPQVFESFFDWIRSYFTEGLEERQRGQGNRGPDLEGNKKQK